MRIVLWVSTLFLVGIAAGSDEKTKRGAHVEGKKTESPFKGKPTVAEDLWARPVADLVYLGPSRENTAVLARTSDRKLKRSEDEGRTWTDVTSLLDGVQIDQGRKRGSGVYSLHVNPIDPSRVVVVGVGNRHWTSIDSGKTFRVMNTTADIREIQFHPTKSDLFLFSEKTPKCYDETMPGPPCSLLVHVAVDFGELTAIISSNVVQFGWGTRTMSPLTVLMARYEPENKPKGGMKFDVWDPLIDLVATEDFFAGFTRVIVPHGNSFSMEGDFLFVATVVPKPGRNEVQLTVSSNGQVFNPVKVPQNLEQFGYSIVDASHGTAFLHVNHGTYQSQWGTLYVSDATGANYTVSLEHHSRTLDGRTDFHKVEGIEGIYMANSVANPRHVADGSETPRLETYITFDKGVEWQPVRAPAKYRTGKAITCDDQDDGACRLHFNGVTNTGGFGPFYSVASAPGIVIASGNVGNFLSRSAADMSAWISRDAGLTWNHAAFGSFIYEIGENGAVIVMASNNEHTNHVLYSVDDGRTWHAHKFREEPVLITNIINNPTSTSPAFIAYGTTEVNQQGIIVHINFEGLKLARCEGSDAAGSAASDFELWYPSHYSGGKCLMGRQVSYTRRKQDRPCWHGDGFERGTMVKPCECTESDYECDYGFARETTKVNSPCVVVDQSAVHTAVKPAYCPENTFYEESSGYRLIGGDTCTAGIDRRPKLHPCSAMVFGSVSHRAFVILLLIGLFGSVLAAVTAYGRVTAFQLWVDEAMSRLPWSVKQWKYEGLGGSANRAPDSLLDDDEYDLQGGEGGGLGDDDLDRVLGNDQDNVTSNGYSQVPTTGALDEDELDDFNPRE